MTTTAKRIRSKKGKTRTNSMATTPRSLRERRMVATRSMGGSVNSLPERSERVHDVLELASEDATEAQGEQAGEGGDDGGSRDDVLDGDDAFVIGGLDSRSELLHEVLHGSDPFFPAPPIGEGGQHTSRPLPVAPSIWAQMSTST